jgi:hypothetical protein
MKRAPLILAQHREVQTESLYLLEEKGKYRESPAQPLGRIQKWLQDRDIETDVIDYTEGYFVASDGAPDHALATFNIWPPDRLLFEAKLRWF